jgi:hypothetical protein
MRNPEIITSDASLSPFGADELSRILELVSHLQGGTSPVYLVKSEVLHISRECSGNQFPSFHLCRRYVKLYTWCNIPRRFTVLTIAKFMHYFCMFLVLMFWHAAHLFSSQSQVLQLLWSALRSSRCRQICVQPDY